MDIRHHLPEQYGFPWQTLKQDLPWASLAHVHLNCPLSVQDAYFVLKSGSNALVEAELGEIFVEPKTWNLQVLDLWHQGRNATFSHLESLALSFSGLAAYSHFWIYPRYHTSESALRLTVIKL